MYKVLIMTITKDWKSACSGASGIPTTCVRKSKIHPKYRKLFSDNTVSVLRQRAKSAGTKKWYSLRKGNLASAIIIHDSAVVVTKFFHKIVDAKRLAVYQTASRTGSTCPISLVLISELHPDDVFVHGNIVFSKESLLDYVRVSVDFLNPITRTMMHLHDIERLGCQYRRS